ncbi:MAG: hypothetical protein V2A56_11640 [bacterium]
MFRKMFWMVAAGCLAVAVTAQAGEQTLLKSGEFSSGGFGGPEVLWTTFNGEDALIVGGTGAWVINRTLYIGGGGYGLASNHDGPLIEGYDGTPKLQMGYGGAMLGLIVRNDDLVYIVGDVMIGGGTVANSTHPGDSDHDNWTNEDTESFWFVQPMLRAELNVTRWMRVSASVGYRSVRDFSGFGITAEDASGTMAGVTFRFGSW